MPGNHVLIEKSLPKRLPTSTMAILMVVDWHAARYVKKSHCFAFCYCASRIVAWNTEE